METLVVAARPRNNHYHGRKRSHGSKRVLSSSPPSSSFYGLNCRVLHSREGSAPLKPCSTKTPVPKQPLCPSMSPKTPSPLPNEIPKMLRRIAKSSSVPIPMNIKFGNNEGGLQFSELWAGPAYSNSPPPSSLPMPKFFLRPKRTVSLELPTVAPEIDLLPFSKSAPASPRVRSPSPSHHFDIADSATKTLRRMLNLDISDE